ncbi:GTP cyclohydrolase 1 type 2 homolog [Oratosquilla oratoria]|uniref:GTP cyclohydrolase 1 type 2 homolog n=1 Tax=Oratosquilla oratoria TaxID=337810 RepID=UPI003F75C2AB
MIDCKTLHSYCHQLLNVDAIADYCPNGLQVEGRAQLEKLMVGVTASEALIAEAEAWGACALLVHHGYFWRGEPEPLVGMKGARVRRLFKNDINLFAYHLPLDVHLELGNNACLVRDFSLQNVRQLKAGGTQGLLWLGELPEPQSAADFAAIVARKLNRQPLLLGDAGRRVRTVALCSGGAQDFIDQAREAGADLFVSGEVSERTTHTARETEISYLAAGHHATERGGVQALGQHLAERFSLQYRFVDIDNPV